MNPSAVFFAAVLAAGQLPRVPIVFERDTILVGEAGYLIGPPLHIAGPGAFDLRWSADGKYLAVVCMGVSHRDQKKKAIGEQVPAILSLAVYEASTGKVMRPRVPEGAVLQISGWMGRTSTLLLTSGRVLPSGPLRNEPEREISVLSWKPGDQQLASIYSTKSDLYLEVSTKQPYAQFVTNLETGERAVLGPSGLVKRVAVIGSSQLDADGYFAIMSRVGKEPNGRPTWGWSRLMPDGTVMKLATEPRFERIPGDIYMEGDVPVRIPIEDPNGLQTALSRTEASHGSVKSRVRSAWLWAPDKGQIKAALIAAEADAILLAPNKKGVAYVSKENLMVREIEALTAQDFERMMEEAEKNELMNRAKQVGVAMMIYSSDADDLMPPNADWQRLLEPYTKSKSLLEGFVYELNGDNLTSVADPSKKRMGYIDGKYGRVIVFADTHVIWDPKRKP